MRIGIDARLAIGRCRGMGRVLLNLITNLSLIDRKNTYFLYIDKADTKGVLPNKPNFKTCVLPPRFYPVWEQISLPLAAVNNRLDLLHCPANTAPLLVPRRTKLVVTIHDVIFFKPRSEIPLSSSWYQNFGRIYRKCGINLLRSRIDHIITVSHFSKDDIQRSLSVSAEKITVIQNTIDEYFFQETREDCKAILQRFQIKKKFIFHLGGIAPSKNTIGVIKAYRLLLQEREYQDIHLVIGGIYPASDDPIARFVKQEQLQDRVKFLGFLTDEELKCLYSKAELFIFPSLYEGFGLPPLEAMASGTPVVASNLTSIPEVVGDSAILVNPRSPSEIKEAMANILRDGQLRMKLIELGKQRVKKFIRWKEGAETLLKVYEELLKR